MPFTNSDGAQIYWEDSGVKGAEPILLIMGLGYAHQMWFRTRPILEAKYRTILFDNRGVGQSDAPPGPYSIAQMADDAEAVLDAAGIGRAHVYGVSMGGMIAQEFALRYPARVNRLILGCTACGGSHAVSAKPPVLQVLMARATMTAEEGAEAMVPYIYDASTPRERIDEDLAIRRSIYPTAQGYMGQVQGIMAWSCFDRLDAIKSPTLVIHGETDQLVPPENAKIIADRITGSKIVMLKNASHIYSTDQPELSHAAILKFLAA
jgi:pimeloyl-ACP methyl ester carboxylesterase